MSDIRSLPPNDAYREGWEAIFGKKEEPQEEPAIAIESKSTLTYEQHVKVMKAVYGGPPWVKEDE